MLLDLMHGDVVRPRQNMRTLPAWARFLPPFLLADHVSNREKKMYLPIHHVLNHGSGSKTKLRTLKAENVRGNRNYHVN